jgi:hypothetical protein
LLSSGSWATPRQGWVLFSARLPPCSSTGTIHSWHPINTCWICEWMTNKNKHNVFITILGRKQYSKFIGVT